MAQPDYDFEYSWEELKPVRPLFVTVLVAQGLGLVAGLMFYDGRSWVESAWLGGALATFLGYLLGLWVQAVMLPGSLGRNRVMVRHLGIGATLFGIFALVFPWLD
ncbi:MAG: hypothetical protein HZA62_13770 [Rhodocyclales bacterium]|nr:hypothetical protein [Rhodocyclales bacterium]